MIPIDNVKPVEEAVNDVKSPSPRRDENDLFNEIEGRRHDV